jgi:hypothetical protein
VILLVPNIATYEIDTDGRDVGLSVGIIGKSQQQARLSNARVSNKQELEEIVVSGLRCQYFGSGQQPLQLGPGRDQAGRTLLLVRNTDAITTAAGRVRMASSLDNLLLWIHGGGLKMTISGDDVGGRRCPGLVADPRLPWVVGS